MSSWAERVHRRAADLGSVVTSCGHPGSSTPGYPYRLEKVKFGVPLDEVCKNNENIPGPLLVLILKLNKESPNKRDVFRAPGHQGAMKKLIHFLQAGRLVNVDNYSVYTIASVLKKFLRKIPNGIFGRTGEKELFAIIELENETEQNDRLHRLFTSLPKYTQHLLVLLFGTFRVIASNAAHAGTGMTSEALGVSVAPSFFQSCVSDGKTARMEDVLKFKVATKIMKYIIDKFATHDLFGRDNYEYYARVTGRILKVQDEWICSFQYPPPPRGKLAQQKYALQHSLEAEKTWLQCQCERWGLLAQEESRSTPALLTSSSSALDNSALSLGVTPEHSFIESCARLSVSLEGPGLFAMTSSPMPKHREHELLLQQHEHREDGGGGSGDYDDDEDNYADDDADGDDEDDFAAELDISNDDDIENNPNIILLKTTTPKKQRAILSGGNGGRVCGAGSLEHDDDLDNDDDEVTFVKRRYRQNKKKMTQTRMQQRRLRACSKSLDGNERISTISNANAENNGNSGNHAAKSKGSKHSNVMMTGAVAAAGATPGSGSGSGGGGGGGRTTRTCSRCNRGIRHSSSCSSASASGGGGAAAAAAAANGSGMTMEELRAVNRYAESTKSLSYLPQVHERQTARMRTRSEWFLGPKGNIGHGLQLPSTCSNCCLAAHQQQQQHQQQQLGLLVPGTSYLGGGSTRDMRTMQRGVDYFADAVNVDVCGGSVKAEALYYQYKRQQLQQHHLQQQQQHYMDTDDSLTGYEPEVHSTRSYLSPSPTTRAAAAAAGSSTQAAAAAALRQQHQYADPNRTNNNNNAILLNVGSGNGSSSGNSGNQCLAWDTNTVGNIRLSNSAESVQYPVRRPSARRLVGLNVPRQYPLRSSLRRHKEKQIGSNLLMGSNGKCTTNIDIDSNQPPSVRNSIAECCSSISSMPHSSSGNILMPTISCNRLPTHASSLENRLALSGVHDICSSNSNSTLMDITEPTKSNVSASGSNMLIYRAPMVSNIPTMNTMNKKPVAVQMSQQQQSEDTTISTKITFKAPRI